MTEALPGPVDVIKVPMLSLSQTAQGLIHTGDYCPAHSPSSQLCAARGQGLLWVFPTPGMPCSTSFSTLCAPEDAQLSTQRGRMPVLTLWTLAFAGNAGKWNCLAWEGDGWAALGRLKKPKSHKAYDVTTPSRPNAL